MKLRGINIIHVRKHVKTNRKKRVILLNKTCAYLSIGVMMKGIVERPSAVVVHLRTGSGHLVVLPSRYSDAAHTRLIVKPGMITEARACHTNVSTTATATRAVFPGLSPWAFRHR